MTTIDDRQAIESVLREFLDAAAQGSFPAGFWTGSVAEAFALADYVEQSTPFPTPVRSGAARIHKLVIRSIDGDSASVDLKADCHSTIIHPVAGERHITRRYRGGAVLRRVSGSWRVVTLNQDGVDLASALFYPVPAEVTVEGVHVQATARFTKGEQLLFLAVRNLGDPAAVLGRIFMAGRVWWLFEDGSVLRQRPLVLRSGASWGMPARMKASPLSRAIEIKVRVNKEEVALRLRPPSRSPARLIRHSLHPNVVLHLLALISLLTIPVAGQKGTAAFALVLLAVGILNFLGEVLSFAGGGRFSAQFFYGGVGLIEVAVAAFLLHRVHVDVIVIATALVLVAPYIWFQYRALLLRRQNELGEVVRGEAPQFPSP